MSDKDSPDECWNAIGRLVESKGSQSDKTALMLIRGQCAEWRIAADQATKQAPEDDLSKKQDITQGVWFQSEVSGLYYKNHLAAGDFRVVVDGKRFYHVESTQKPHDRPLTADNVGIYLGMNVRYLPPDGDGLGRETGPVVAMSVGKAFKEYNGEYTINVGDYEFGNLDLLASDHVATTETPHEPPIDSIPPRTRSNGLAIAADLAACADTGPFRSLCCEAARWIRDHYDQLEIDKQDNADPLTAKNWQAE